MSDQWHLTDDNADQPDAPEHFTATRDQFSDGGMVGTVFSRHTVRLHRNTDPSMKQFSVNGTTWVKVPGQPGAVMHVRDVHTNRADRATRMAEAMMRRMDVAGRPNVLPGTPWKDLKNHGEYSRIGIKDLPYDYDPGASR